MTNTCNHNYIFVKKEKEDMGQLESVFGKMEMFYDIYICVKCQKIKKEASKK